MKKLPLLISGTLFSALLLTGCNEGYYNTYSRPDRAPHYSYDTTYRFGTVTNVEYFSTERSGPGAGAVVGAIVGGVVGNQFGSGSGRTAATIGGAALGGVAGNAVQNRNRGQYAEVQVSIRLTDGQRIQVVQSDNGQNFYNGQSVRVIGTGNNARVEPGSR